jgi:hypothetical protein
MKSVTFDQKLREAGPSPTTAPKSPDYTVKRLVSLTRPKEFIRLSPLRLSPLRLSPLRLSPLSLIRSTNIMETILNIVVTPIAVISATAVGGLISADRVGARKSPSQNLGVVQKKVPYLRTARAAVVGTDYENKTEGEWMKVPHIRAICTYARTNDRRFWSFYWTKQFVILHYLYTEWMSTLPMDSLLREAGREGDLARVFVELHLHHFRSGISGWANNKFQF